MATKFRKGQKVVCIHYKDHPVLIVDSVDIKSNALWVFKKNAKGLVSDYWYGPLNWFKPLRKKIRKPKPITKPRGLFNEGSLCDSGIPGCTCNQWASVSQ